MNMKNMIIDTILSGHQSMKKEKKKDKMKLTTSLGGEKQGSTNTTLDT